LKIGPIGSPETSVTNYQSAPRNILEERIYHEPRRIFAILKTSDLRPSKLLLFLTVHQVCSILVGYGCSVSGLIEETGLLEYYVASRGVSRRFEGLCCLHLEGFRARIASPRT